MARYKIGVDFHTWDGIFQGSRSHILGVYREAIVQAPDLDFVFFLNDTEGLRAAFAEFSNPNVALVKVPPVPSLWRLVFQLPWHALKHKIDILHTQYRVPPMAPCKTACTIHDLLCESHPQFFGRTFVAQSRLTFRLSAKMADVLFSVSNFSAQEIVHRYGIRRERIGVTFNGVDQERFHPGTDGEDVVRSLGLTPHNYIITVGRLEPRKNQANLIRAWGRLGEGAPDLVIVGQPDFSFHDIFEAQKEIAPKRAIMLDKVSDEQLPALLRHARLFAYPAFAEGFGMPVIEALASGVPVVTSSTTSLPEVAGDAAILIDPSDVEAISQGLTRGLALGSDREEVIRKGVEQAQRFDWSASAKVLIKRFRDALR
ncbi:glycosyltransferase family 4 protein [Aquabacterium sp.]|jgi:glycosyltransferase involved in cell wall biosynthesis|uniref:glycosyltransferase family 4 protein n=1 Tax=Aquabacterium sp. TaxID=1872578 RepID=UPI003D057283